MRKVLYIFGLLTDGDIEWMAKNGTCRRLSDGEVLIEEGGRSDSLILLLEGELQVSARGYGDVARMGVGEIVGEVSLVDSAPPSATITTRGEGLALFLDKRQLLEKLEHDESFGSRFYRALAVFLADRLRATRQPATDRLLDGTALSRDELDIGIMDHVTAAGERFSRLLRMLHCHSVN
ncbi:cyclic nucleotide-binding domain-containing protein [Bradyrhizobium hipponense]|uniref:Cyclic nucleotide-binding domain-containing protein n=1 Tax=Bradyrhizobium hipponense TaxID=2605638 RepID=A0A5S4YXQ3_9BRAD|nr:cyclic nucleotide-binding domain-containing protein [Bradyrhizobium hipponense]